MIPSQRMPITGSKAAAFMQRNEAEMMTGCPVMRTRLRAQPSFKTQRRALRSAARAAAADPAATTTTNSRSSRTIPPSVEDLPLPDGTFMSLVPVVGETPPACSHFLDNMQKLVCEVRMGYSCTNYSGDAGWAGSSLDGTLATCLITHIQQALPPLYSRLLLRTSTGEVFDLLKKGPLEFGKER